MRQGGGDGALSPSKRSLERDGGEVPPTKPFAGEDSGDTPASGRPTGGVGDDVSSLPPPPPPPSPSPPSLPPPSSTTWTWTRSEWCSRRSAISRSYWFILCVTFMFDKRSQALLKNEPARSARWRIEALRARPNKKLSTSFSTSRHMGRHDKWNVTTNGTSRHMGRHETWEITTHGRSRRMGDHDEWDHLFSSSFWYCRYLYLLIALVSRPYHAPLLNSLKRVYPSTPGECWSDCLRLMPSLYLFY